MVWASCLPEKRREPPAFIAPIITSAVPAYNVDGIAPESREPATAIPFTYRTTVPALNVNAT